jgi:hypothetical protein
MVREYVSETLIPIGFPLTDDLNAEDLRKMLHKNLGKRLCIKVDRSTKCHPELAGKEIEYSWGRAKSVYRCAKLTEKKGKETFIDWLKAAFLPKKGLEKVA